MVNAENIGRYILTGAKNYSGILELYLATLKRATSLNIVPVRLVLYKQIYFTGFEALGKVAVIGVMLGLVIMTQIENIVGIDSVIVGKILTWTIVRELGPLFCAIVIIARSCTAIASELGTMKINRELDSIKAMGIDPIAYLIVPRIAGVTLAVFILTFYFQAFAILGGLILSALLTGIPFVQYWNGILAELGLFDIGISMIKSLIFGLLISCISCFHGLRVKHSITEVPQMTTVAVMQSLFMVIIFDGIITLGSFI